MESYRRFAELYDSFMDDVDYDGWAKYVALLIKSCLRSEDAASVLECGCGTGEISLRLARLGFSVTASDASEDMLALAQQKSRRMGLRLPFVRMDMRALTTHRPVDAVIACCDCVNYLTAEDDALAFFHSARAALKEGGLLAFDVSSEHKLKNMLDGSAFTDSREDMAYFWSNCYDEPSRLIEMRLEFFKRTEGACLYERFTETHIQRAYSAEELIGLLTRAGFCKEDIRVYDAFTTLPARAESERLQFTAAKRTDR